MNVIDFYKYWTEEAIKADLDAKRHNFSVVVQNEIRDFNLGTVIRNANAFLAENVFVVGCRQYDKRATVGTHRYENIKRLRVCEIESLKTFIKEKGAIVIGVDNIPRAHDIQNFPFPNLEKHHTVLVFGEESIGITESLKELCEVFVYIKQYGSVRSLNVGCASAIAMYELMRGY